MARVCWNVAELKAGCGALLCALLGGCTGGAGDDRAGAGATASIPQAAAAPQSRAGARSRRRPARNGAENPAAPVIR